MAIDLHLLGSKLAKYREQLQESLLDVAGSTGIGLARLAQIEGGQTEPTGDEVLILADHYRCDFQFFISNEQIAPIEQTETLYRAHGSDFSKEDRRAVQDFLYLCETEDFLMRSWAARQARSNFRLPVTTSRGTPRPQRLDCDRRWDMRTTLFPGMCMPNSEALVCMSFVVSLATRTSRGCLSRTPSGESVPW